MTDARNPISLVIIDDNPRSLEFLSTALRCDGLQIFTAADPEEGMDLVYARRPQVVMTDLVMPGMTGLEVLERVTEFDPVIDVILMTAHYTTDTAVEAIRKGAADYLNKPISLATLRDRVGRIIDAALRRQQVRNAEDRMLETAQFEGIVGRSPQMWEMFSRIQRVAPHYRAALITGQTGTGKELVAQALHRLSLGNGKFVVLNCSAVVETLFESELFGHVRGAFTGADRDKMGLFEHASGGTLFLDEIGDMPLSTQAKLLRVLQNQEVQRVGSLTSQRVDVRVVAATNKDLRTAITDRQFREDLYFRLSMVEIQSPSLAERMDDLPLLARHFVKKFSHQYKKDIRGLTQRAQILLGRHTWPGNVRELENVIGHGSMMTMTDMIDVADLPFLASRSPRIAIKAQPSHSPATVETSTQSLEEHEKRLVTDALTQAEGNQSKAARQLRIGRDALRYKMKKFGLL
ncbi:MAG: response regulator with CheY-like receiver, AAA-type ATPase, and DNA-binding domain [Candidatus Angelobacter sp.]|nr:response regulator with CheY-like receiver, AAA-type ATPase, and DNA-binding domain [Candidatus Angelobacter sp.]